MKYGASVKGDVIHRGDKVEIIQHIGSPRFRDRPAGKHEYTCQCGHPYCTGKRSSSTTTAIAPDDTQWL